MTQWWNEHISGRLPFLVNESVPVLVEQAIQGNEGKLSLDGALVVKTGKFTGRAAEDKYVVTDEYSRERIDWENNIRGMGPSQFEGLKYEVLKNFNSRDHTLYIMERSVGADPAHSLGVRFITNSASHALFARNIFRENVASPGFGHFTVYHCPDLELDPLSFGLRSSTAIAINFSSQEVVIVGTAYAGEIKKAIFSVMNVLLPDASVLPMHSGANIDSAGKVSVFFGLSGTGKTTLSTDEGQRLIGDDEHGLSLSGIFNIEGGCYAKTYKLTEKGEPQVYHATNRFGSLMENVVMDESRKPIFDDNSLTENGRVSYPLSFINDSVVSGSGPFPSNIFFLSADAMGVLPAVARLSQEQSMYYFLSGYTAKLAGTEIGLDSIKATFSHCFGAPFMMRHAMTYAEVLEGFMKAHPVKVWMINTGWYGGAYGVGKRYDLSITRNIIRSIQQGLPTGTDFKTESVFGLSIPTEIPGVDAKYLWPETLWKSPADYHKIAVHLKQLFEDNYRKFAESDQDKKSSHSFTSNLSYHAP